MCKYGRFIYYRIFFGDLESVETKYSFLPQLRWGLEDTLYQVLGFEMYLSHAVTLVLNWSQSEINIFSKSIIISQLTFTCSSSRQLNQKKKKILIGASAWSCYANFERVIPDEMCHYITSQKPLQTS